ncbi:hypothetical protein BJV82DRAFT_612290 [Fennellomyces sp. T-0311]|nr:hypothetical protein BJV82DRAFT_612290 [Fennellomyces sp. T-0311]
MKAMKARQVKKLWRMKPKGKANFATLTLEETRDRVQSLIGVYFKSHVHVQHDDENGTDWIRISIYVHDELSQVPTTYDTCIIIRYPETPFVVRIGNITSARASIIQQVIVQTFDAKSIVEESFLTGQSLPRLDHYVEHHASLGAVSQLRLQSNDSNPLQLDSPSSSSNKRPAEEPYVKGREQRRRIVPLDHEVLDSRMRHVADTFGVDVVQGVEKLELHMETPLEDTVDENVLQLLPYQDVKINMNITFKGKNVLGGMRHLMLTGHMDTPVPSWMVAIASQGVNKAHIKDGQVLQEVEVDSDEDMDELFDEP